MNKETKIQRLQMMALSEDGRLVFRNETAGAWVGKIIHKSGDQVTLSGARMIKFGLCEGSSDIIGITPIVITQEMVGETVGIFSAWETKTKTGKPSKEQKTFIENVKKFGGFAGIARTIKEALEIGE